MRFSKIFSFFLFLAFGALTCLMAKDWGIAGEAGEFKADTAAPTSAEIAAGTGFIYASTMKPGLETFNPTKWTLDQTNPTIKFKARTQAQLEVVFSADPAGAGSVYKFVLGQDNGFVTSLLGINASQGTNYTNIPGCDNITVGAVRGKLANEYHKYWVALFDNVFLFGTGDTVGKNTMGSWTVTQPIPQPKFFGLGSWGSEVDFKNIRSIPNQPIPDVLTYAFQFVPNPMAQGKVIYNANWKTTTPGDIELKFNADTLNDIYVELAPSINADAANCVLLNIGGNYNAQTWVQNGRIKGSTHYGNPVADSIQPGMNSYWVKLAGSTLTYGKGTTVGKGTIGTWTLPSSVNTSALQYVGFGGWNQIVTYRNISIANNISILQNISGAKSIALEIPNDWMAEPGSLERVSVGIKDGRTEAWGITEKGGLRRYDPTAGSPYTMPSLEVVDPWLQEDLKDNLGQVIPYLVDISVSSDGDMVAIRGDDKTAIKYDWTKKIWQPLPASNASTIQLMQIVIVNDKTIYAAAQDSNIYSYNGKAWQPLGPGAYVAAGMSTANKVIVIGISDTGKAYESVGTAWKPLAGATNLDEVAIGNENNIFGVSKNGLLWKLDYKTSKWAPVLGKDKKQASGFASISVNKAGTIVALDGDGDSYLGGTTPTVATTAGATTTAAAITRVAAVASGKVKAKKITKTTVKKKAKASSKAKSVKKKAKASSKAKPGKTKAKSAAKPKATKQKTTAKPKAKGA